MEVEMHNYLLELWNPTQTSTSRQQRISYYRSKSCRTVRTGTGISSRPDSRREPFSSNMHSHILPTFLSVISVLPSFEQDTIGNAYFLRAIHIIPMSQSQSQSQRRPRDDTGKGAMAQTQPNNLKGSLTAVKPNLHLIVVTNDWHMDRTRAMFEKVFSLVCCSSHHSISTDALSFIRSFIR